jgi:hypothetical protein
VEVIKPPITTVAKGRCTSLPALLLMSHGQEAERGDQGRGQHGPQPFVRAFE